MLIIAIKIYLHLFRYDVQWNVRSTSKKWASLALIPAVSRVRRLPHLGVRVQVLTTFTRWDCVYNLTVKLLFLKWNYVCTSSYHRVFVFVWHRSHIEVMKWVSQSVVSQQLFTMFPLGDLDETYTTYVSW